MTVGAEQWSDNFEKIKEQRDNVKYGIACAKNEKAKSCQNTCDEVKVRFIKQGEKKITKTMLQRYVRLSF